MPNATDGAQVIQTTASSDTKQHFAVKDSSGGYVRFINRHSGKALDLWEWSTADGGIVAQYADLDGANQQWQLVKVGSGGTTSPTSGGGGSSSGLIGWATQGGGTTGGAGGATVTVTTLDALTTEAKSATTETIRVSGRSPARMTCG